MDVMPALEPSALAPKTTKGSGVEVPTAPLSEGAAGPPAATDGFASHLDAQRSRRAPAKAPNAQRGEQSPPRGAPTEREDAPETAEPPASIRLWSELAESQETWTSPAALDLERFEVLDDPEAALELAPAAPLIPRVALAASMAPMRRSEAPVAPSQTPTTQPGVLTPHAKALTNQPEALTTQSEASRAPQVGEAKAWVPATPAPQKLSLTPDPPRSMGAAIIPAPEAGEQASTSSGPPAAAPAAGTTTPLTTLVQPTVSSAPPADSGTNTAVPLTAAATGAGAVGGPSPESTTIRPTADPTGPSGASEPPPATGELPRRGSPRAEPTSGQPTGSAAPRMSATPEAMLFTWEFDTTASQGVAQAPSTAVAPSLLAQLAAASRAEVPLAPVAMPAEVRFVINDPQGDIHLSVGREARDVAVKVEVPTGLMAAVKEAEAPIRSSLQDEGYQLEGYEVREREDGVQHAPERDRHQPEAQRGRQNPRRSTNNSPASENPPPEKTAGLRLLDRRA